jgi:vacuolar protein sorting-associated protein IST1
MQATDPPPASVPPRILSKLALYTPPKELVDAYLGEIAKSYGVPFEASHPIEPLDEDKTKGEGGDDEDGPGEGQEKEEAKVLEMVTGDKGSGKKANVSPKKDGGAVLPELPSTTPAEVPSKKVNEDDELAKRFERLKNLR